MISGVFGGVARFVTLAAPLVSVFLISGCDSEGYPADLKYPTRTDLIIVTQNPDEETQPEPPGHLEISVATYKKLQDEGKTVKFYDPALLTPKQRGEITAALEKIFGTPAKPRVKIASADDEDLKKALEDLQLDNEKILEAGSVLYRRNCQHCHGISGNGRGPTAAWLHPHPRDYRKGVFKFISTEKRAPSRNDLYRVLKNGIDYTSMPSFALLSDKELDELISYVIHLSLRGQAEEATMNPLIDKQELQVDGDTVSIDRFLQDRARNAVTSEDGWAASNQSVRTPAPEDPKVKEGREKKTKKELLEAQQKEVAIGYKLFISDDAGCLKCHKDYGRQALYRYDAWGTMVRPRNLTAGQYRGGRRPIDFYWRIKNGINPSTMPAIEVLLTADEKAELEEMTKKGKPAAEVATEKAKKTEANIWRLIAFIETVPYSSMLPKDIHDAVYPTVRPSAPVVKKD